MPYLLDTNIVSYILKAPDGEVSDRFRRVAIREIFVFCIVEAELRFGALAMPADAYLPSSLNDFLMKITSAPWDSRCAQEHAKLRTSLKKNPLSWPDSMIAAQALSLGFTLVTHDQAFSRVHGLRLQDWTRGPRLL